MVLRRLFGRSAERRTPACVPEGVRVYAIGDIHGRFDLVNRMASLIERDGTGVSKRRIGVFLGDYVDRGPASRDVIEWLEAGPSCFDETICLKGNHELALEDFIADPGALATWRQFGGYETLYSYGVRPPLSLSAGSIRESHAAFVKAMPARHRSFVKSLTLYHEIGDYFFVHAGVRPGVPLAAQDENDLLWIRDPFLGSRRNFGKIIVHGHTPHDEPEMLANRINVDTGAFATGVLTCLVLDGADKRFLQTGYEPSAA